ncbi:MAG: ATP-binding cassette domain-containing protein [Chlamydiia bacterium]|nr:ATP-binding cassette domain-containing protein [Chlamydiia bacterium]
MKTPAIQISSLFFSYEARPILQDIHIAIEQGAFIGIIGPNGGGKTTLLKLIMGLLQPDSGSIQLFGNPPIQARARIGYVPQAIHVDRDFPITVFDLVLLGYQTNTFKLPPHAKDAALYWLEELGLIAYKSKAFASLSGGLAQRALLARALVADPSLLILDEPTANIDPHSRMQILSKLESFQAKKTLLLVTHDLKTIIEQVTRILCIQTQATSYLPNEVCEHFALGLYHTPLIPSPTPKVPCP